MYTKLNSASVSSDLKALYKSVIIIIIIIIIINILLKFVSSCRVLSLSDRRYSLNPLSQTRID